MVVATLFGTRSQGIKGHWEQTEQKRRKRDNRHKIVVRESNELLVLKKTDLPMDYLSGVCVYREYRNMGHQRQSG